MNNKVNNICITLVLSFFGVFDQILITLFKISENKNKPFLGTGGIIGFNNIYDVSNVKSVIYNNSMHSPMDQFEIQPFLGNFLGLNYTSLSLITNILVYIGLVVTFVLFFYIYGSFKDNIKING